MGNEQNVIKNFASSITNDDNNYNGYYEINVSNKQWFDDFKNSKETRIILDRSSKYKEHDKAQEMKEEEDDRQQAQTEEGIIFNDIIENMDGFGVFQMKTNAYHFKKCEFCIETKNILAFSEFHDVIESISLQRKKVERDTTYTYLISFIYPPNNTQFELFKYKIKHISAANKAPFLKIHYMIQRMTKQSLDEKQILSDLQTLQTKLQSKIMEKNKNTTYDAELIWIEEYNIQLQSRFDTMLSDCDIWIPIRSLQNKQIKSLSINSSVLKWGNIQQIQMGQMQYIKWHLRFIKGGGMHTVTVHIQMIAKDKDTKDSVLSKPSQRFTNYEDDSDEKSIRDSVIKCSWNKHYFALSEMMITRYFIEKNDEKHAISSWIQRNTQKSCKMEMEPNAFAFLDELETMKGSIITLDKRKALKQQHSKQQQMKHIPSARNEFFIDCHENEKGGSVLVKNNVAVAGTYACNVFKYCIKMKDELLFITRYHSSLFLVEYKLVKTKKGYRYIYYMYSFAAPYGEFELFRYKRSGNKRQALIKLKCSKYILNKEDSKNNNTEINSMNEATEWKEHYRFTLDSHFAVKHVANDVCLNIPVFINSAQQKNIKIKSFASGLLQKGKLRYSESAQCLRWNIGSFKGKSEITRNVEFKLCKINQDIELRYVSEDDKNNVLVFGECEINKMEIADHTLSGIVISAVKLINNTQLKYKVWIRYCTIISSTQND